MEGFFPPEANELFSWARDLHTASRIFGKPMEIPNDIEQIMGRVGLTDTQHRIVRVPLRCRPGFRGDAKLSTALTFATAHPYPQDKNDSFKTVRVPQTFESLTMSLFTRELRMQPQAVAGLCERLRAIMLIPGLPIYFDLYAEHTSVQSISNGKH